MKYVHIAGITATLISFIWTFYMFILPKINKKNIVSVPIVVGSNLSEAKRSIEKTGLSYEIVYIESEFDSLIISSWPKQNTKVKEKSKIILYVGYTSVDKCPDFTNQFFYEIEDEIRNFCVKYNISYYLIQEVNNSYPEGIITKQSIEPGTQIDSDSITFTMAITDQLFEVPKLIGMNENDAIEAINKTGLKTNIIYEYSNQEFGTVINQSIEAGSRLRIGNSSTINIFVSKGGAPKLDSFIGENSASILDYCNKYNIEYEIEYVLTNEEVDKVVALRKHLYYDIDRYLFTIYITKN